MRHSFILILVVALLLVGVAKLSVKAAPPKESNEFIYTVAPQYEALAWMHGSERFPAGAQLLVHDAKGQHALLKDFAASADASISFDGQHVLFAGKQKSSEPWQVWEASITGDNPHRITSGTEDCVRPFYLPEDRIVFACKVEGRYVIEALNFAGGKPLPLTYSPSSALPTDVLRDGRILFESAYAEEVAEIYTVYSDGSGVESYRCDHGTSRYEGRQVSSGDIVFVSKATLARFTSARAQQVAIAASPGEYAGDVRETSSGDWLLPWRSNSNEPYQIVLWTRGATSLRPVLKEQSANAIQPAPIAERPVPNRHPSGLHDWPNANLLCLNAYTSKYKFAAGSIHSLKFYTRDQSGSAKLLGEAPVERDGSFFVQVPNDQPIQVELVDAAGKTLKRESGYFWARRGEQRVCVGCHSGPETSPENAVPMTLLKSTTPADLTSAAAAAAAQGGH